MVRKRARKRRFTDPSAFYYWLDIRLKRWVQVSMEEWNRKWDSGKYPTERFAYSKTPMKFSAHAQIKQPKQTRIFDGRPFFYETICYSKPDVETWKLNKQNQGYFVRVIPKRVGRKTAYLCYSQAGRKRREQRWIVQMIAVTRDGHKVKFADYHNGTRKSIEDWFKKNIRPRYRRVISVKFLPATGKNISKIQQWFQSRARAK